MADPADSALKPLQPRKAAWLTKIDSRTLTGVTRTRFWCVAAVETPVFFWYKAEQDVRPVGRVQLCDATFNFDPRQAGQFNIRTSDQSFVFETVNVSERLAWLKYLQSIRRRHRGIDVLTLSPSHLNESVAELCSHRPAPPSPTTSELQTYEHVPDVTSFDNLLREPENDDVTLDTAAASTTFYVTEEGQLNELSWQVPPSIGEASPASLASEVYQVMRAAANRPRSESGNSHTDSPLLLTPDKQHKDAEVPDRNRKSRLSIRVPSFSKHKAACENCQELLSVVNQLKTRCHDLSDEKCVEKEMITTLRKNLLSSKNQIEALEKLSSLSEFGARTAFILEREKQLTNIQLQCAHLNRQLQNVQHKLAVLEVAHEQSEGDLEAYKSSIRTKEELIMQLVAEKDQSRRSTDKETADLCEAAEAIDLDLGNTSGDSSTATGSAGPARSMSLLATSQNIHEHEHRVDDMPSREKLFDLVTGFESQNAFLNQEILDLQATIQKVEDNENKVQQRNFTLEAEYYQLKSKYLLLLNHVQADTRSAGSLSANEVTDLIRTATSQSLTPQIDNENTDQSINEHLMSESTASGNTPSNTHLFDSLGFRLDSKSRTATEEDLVTKATQLHQKADDLRAQQKQEKSKEYVEWLHKWDSFLVNQSHKPFAPSNELKSLVRTGVPHSYRSRVWKILVHYVVKDVIDEVGLGYYQSLVKRSKHDEYDVMLKQIDLDLNRTLPGNKYFEDADSEKIQQLRRVLYAYRYHNPAVGYCQGLNRLVAVGLLYLSEADAFWLLIACVEYVQPPHYYTSNLIGAIADQKVLLDLVCEKLPRTAAILKQFDVDVSLFTLSWFITCFIDALPHRIYLKIIDCMLLEQNKVLFRFGLALLKLNEKHLLACRTVGAVHSCLSHIGYNVHDYQALAQVAFHDINPFSHKQIESKRKVYLTAMQEQGMHK